MTTSSDTSPTGYRIGKVSRLTGISPDTLRIWERRYNAVTPQRSPAGGRLYTANDIARLKLIKKLIDAGDSIGAVAGLEHEDLNSRLSETQDTVITNTLDRPYRLVVIGDGLVAKIRATQQRLSHIDLVASYPSIQALESEAKLIEADVFVIEQPTLQTEVAIRISDLLTQLNAMHVVVIYRFASQEALNKLPLSRSSTMRAPVEISSLQEHLIALGGIGKKDDTEAQNTINIVNPGPPRRYNDETLAKLATMSSTIKCECPKHLAELLTSLTAFEQYSTECESRNKKDAELHNYLHTAASHARHIIENALDMIIDVENIDIQQM